jgi:hypothetical protein
MSDITVETKLSNQLRLSEEKFKGAFEYSSKQVLVLLVNGFGLILIKIDFYLGYTKPSYSR